MKTSSLALRRLADRTIKLLSVPAAMLALLALGWILYEVVARGLGALDYSFFTRLPTPPGMEGGGLANAILGTLMITVLATILGVPLGLMAGIYLAEFGLDSWPARIVRFSANIVMGTPSIIVGVFVYTIMVRPLKHFSGYAGSAALAVIMLPVVTRTAEDILSLVPKALREAALALGAPHWKVTLGVVFRAAKAGLITGTLLAIARVSGETAPLLFTALNSPYWPRAAMDGPTPNLTVTIFNYAMSPYQDWKEQAWAASLLVMAGVLVLAVFSRMIFQERGSRK